MGVEHVVPIEQRLLSRRVITLEGCWQYTGKISVQGYGVIGYLAAGSSTKGVHVVAHLLWIGPIPDGHQVDHLCHTNNQTCAGGRTCLHRRCFNPKHLEAVTAQENNARSRRATKPTCAKGHPYTPENTMHPPSLRGQRRCKKCTTAQTRARRARQKENRP